MKEIEGYILTDVESFPDIPFWIFKKDIIQEWWEKGWLGKTTKISRERALGLINSVSK